MDTVIFIAILLFVLAFIAFFVSAQKGIGRKIFKVGACLVYFVLFLSLMLANDFFLSTLPRDILYIIVPAITFCVAPPVAFFVQRKNLKTKIFGITALVMLLLGIALVTFFAIMAVLISRGNWL
ncbi:MAG: hypothetical protein FWH20_10890 [Oscillospiraceae bacterium]|nr:hypothetical protein [Oscillospiraceae bacterium]